MIVYCNVIVIVEICIVIEFVCEYFMEVVLCVLWDINGVIGVLDLEGLDLNVFSCVVFDNVL